MAKLIENGKRTKYDSYDEYVKIQDSRYHDYDDPNCAKQNLINIKKLQDRGFVFKSLLDIGCRDAAYFDELSLKGIACTGIDISEKSVKYCISKNRKVILGDACKLSEIFSNKFDLINSNHSFEHLLKPEKVLEECYKVLNNHGHMIINLPNEGDKIRNTKTMAHVRAYAEKDLTKMIKDTKFKTILFESNPNTHEIFTILEK